VIVAAFAFLGGVLALLTLPAMPHTLLATAVALTVPLALVWRRHVLSRATAFACCGFLFAAAHAHHHLQRTWPEDSANERVRADVVVETIPTARGDGWSFDGRIRIIAPRPSQYELHTRLISRDPAVRPHAGERWHMLLALRPPQASLNPGGVDMERLLFHDRVHAMGTVVTSRLNQRVDTGHRPLTALRERIAQRVDRRVIDRDAAGLITALAVGATGAMSREQWRVFNATGTTHLVAISGMHVTMFAFVTFAVARWLWSIGVSRWTSWPRENFAAAIGLAAATAYALLAGLSIPTQRTLVMLAAWLLARSMARASPPMQPLAIALVAVLLLDPFAPLAAGFWLSFGAMGAILLVTQTRMVRRATLQEAVAVQLTVAALLVPLTLACYGSVSLLGPLVNAAAIPYISWLLVPIILLALALMPLWPAAADHALSLAEWLHDIAWPWLAAAADSPLALAYASPPSWWYALAAVGIVIALTPWPLRLRLAAIVCVLPLVAANRGAPSPGGMELTALDVGEGTAVVIQTAAHVLLYGTGESYGTEGSRVENIIVPFLRSRGVRAVDALMISTSSTRSGVTALLAALPVKRTLIGGGGAADFSGAGPCNAGEEWSWDGVRFRLLASCNLSIETARAEAEIAPSSVLLGDVVIIPGRSHRDGKERRAVVAWRQERMRVLATGDEGAVRATFHPSAGVVALEGLREERRALWHQRPAP
jgi:competence protein ComEC